MGTSNHLVFHLNTLVMISPLNPKNNGIIAWHSNVMRLRSHPHIKSNEPWTQVDLILMIFKLLPAARLLLGPSTNTWQLLNENAVDHKPISHRVSPVSPTASPIRSAALSELRTSSCHEFFLTIILIEYLRLKFANCKLKLRHGDKARTVSVSHQPCDHILRSLDWSAK